MLSNFTEKELNFVLQISFSEYESLIHVQPKTGSEHRGNIQTSVEMVVQINNLFVQPKTGSEHRGNIQTSVEMVVQINNLFVDRQPTDQPVSSVGRVPDYRAGGRGFKPTTQVFK